MRLDDAPTVGLPNKRSSIESQRIAWNKLQSVGSDMWAGLSTTSLQKKKLKQI